MSSLLPIPKNLDPLSRSELYRNLHGGEYSLHIQIHPNEISEGSIHNTRVPDDNEEEDRPSCSSLETSETTGEPLYLQCKDCVDNNEGCVSS